MRVGVVTRHPQLIPDDLRDTLEWAHSFEDLDDSLAAAEFVVLALPLVPETTGLIDRDRIAVMHDRAILINVSRGPVIDELAVFEALSDGKLSGVALDVWRVEETRGKSGYPSPMPWHTVNALMTPHYSGATPASRARQMRIVGANLRRWVAGEPLENVVALRQGEAT
jgi:phosphoglycerate dehydrogenase-like enzyme